MSIKPIYYMLSWARIKGLLVCLALIALPLSVRAQEREVKTVRLAARGELASHTEVFSVPVIAGASRAVFDESRATLSSVEDGRFVLSVIIRNSGNLSTSSTKVSLLLAEAWEYEGSDGAYDYVATHGHPYGQYVEWRLPEIDPGTEANVTVNLNRPNGHDASLFLAVVSDVSVPVYADLAVDKQEEEEQRFHGSNLDRWMAQFRQLWREVRFWVQRLFLS